MSNPHSSDRHRLSPVSVVSASLVATLALALVAGGCARSGRSDWAQTAPTIQAGGTELAVFDSHASTTGAQRVDDAPVREN